MTTEATAATITMKQMCEAIVEADFLRFKDGRKPTPEEVFNYSPSGELYQVFAWYDVAVALKDAQASAPRVAP